MIHLNLSKDGRLPLLVETAASCIEYSENAKMRIMGIG